MAILQLLTAATAVSAAPTLGTQGASIVPEDSRRPGLAEANKAHIVLVSTAGTGAMTVTARIWGYFRINSTTAFWCPLGTHATPGSKGVLNEGTAIAATGVNEIRHAEVLEFIEGIERVYMEVTAIGGTATAISCWLSGIVEQTT